mmetsp:Transcript_53880/g.165793  ORF Transcript_53880/g.165793 Transcript_53880/m.165793 type:complete len:234 (+) Transcript_53880:639-1340(+)
MPPASASACVDAACTNVPIGVGGAPPRPGSRTMSTNWKRNAVATSLSVRCVDSTLHSGPYRFVRRSSAIACMNGAPMVLWTLTESVPRLPTEQRPEAKPHRIVSPFGCADAMVNAAVAARRAGAEHGHTALNVALKWSPWKAPSTPPLSLTAPETRDTNSAAAAIPSAGWWVPTASFDEKPRAFATMTATVVGWRPQSALKPMTADALRLLLPSCWVLRRECRDETLRESVAC